MAYEEYNRSLVYDSEYDAASRLIDPSIETGNVVLDEFFKTKFAPHTGSWIHEHPELDRIDELYRTIYVNHTETPYIERR